MFGLFRRKKKKEAQKQKEELQKEKVVLKEEKEEPIKTEELVEEPTVETEEDTEEQEEKKAKPRKMSYHITKHPKGGWQIKKGGAERALKRFDTQKEAIEYAKELEKSGASYIIHKTDGTTRKKKY